MEIDASITISRRSTDEMVVTVFDNASRSQFVELRFSPEDLMMAISGLASVHASKASVRNLEFVGMTKISEPRSVVSPLKEYDRAAHQKWLIENCQEEGWDIDPYLGSQNSVVTINGETKLNYRVYKYISDEVPA